MAYPEKVVSFAVWDEYVNPVQQDCNLRYHYEGRIEVGADV